MGPMNGGPINLSSARLRRASLRFATLSGANLESADLSGADLTDARLDGANLANADLSQAVLDHADFARARLAGANLCGANLAKARNLTEAQLAEGVGDASTLLPPHLRAPEVLDGDHGGVRSPAGGGGRDARRHPDRASAPQEHGGQSVVARRWPAADCLGGGSIIHIYQ